MKDVDWPMWPTATVPLANAGLVVGDRYELRSQIGLGAMGAVWLAQDRRLGRSVALKQVVLEPGLDAREATEARQRILREGRIAARLQHPNAVCIYDVTMHENEPWLVMEYVPSRSLASVLTEEGLLTDREAAQIGMQLAEALEAAHEAGIVHRDVKPGNVLVRHDGRAKLVDFGIARAAGDVTVTQTGVLTGTPDYFAPEIARGAKPSAEADIFALGATLYICVEGVPPFGTGRNALTQLQIIADGKVRPPEQAGRLTSVLLQLLASEPEQRPDARRAAALLRAVAEGAPSTPAPRPEQTPIRNAAKPDRPAPETVNPGSEPRTTKIPPPRAAPDQWDPDAPGARLPGMRLPGMRSAGGPTPFNPRSLPNGRALPPTPRELASVHIPTGRAAHRARSAERRRQIGLIAVVGAVAVGLLAAAVWFRFGGGSDPDTVPPVPKAGVTTTADATRDATESQLTSTVRDYFALLPQETGEAWNKLTPRAQARIGGQSAYTGQWGNITTLRVVSTDSSAADQTVRAQVRTETSDGVVRTSTQRLAVTHGPNGQWLIDRIDD
jgi:serine/threonine protein kinase